MCALPLEVSGHRDLPVDQSLHDPADDLEERPGHVLTELAFITLLHLVPREDRDRSGQQS